MTENGYGLGLCYEGKKCYAGGHKYYPYRHLYWVFSGFEADGKTVQAEDDIALLAESEWVFCSFSIALDSFLK